MNLQYVYDNHGVQTGVLIPINDWNLLKRKYKGLVTLENNEIEYKEPTKEEILEGIRQGLKEVKLIKEGKLKAQSFEELINEL